MTSLSRTFRSMKNRRLSSSPSKPSSSSTTPAVNNNSNTNGNDEKTKTVTSSSSSKNSSKTTRKKTASLWSVYLIISSRLPKTYVGVTTDFSHRLKQHNGELKGGAKASSAGRPWTLACIVGGFMNRSEACEFESKWKSISRKMPRKKRKEDLVSNSLLEHREAALSRLKASFDCSNLLIEWKSSSH